MRRFLACIALVLAAACTGAQSRVTLSLGHAGPVNAVAGRAELNMGFSVGADGRLIVWNLEHGGLDRSWQVSHHPLVHLAIHPAKPQAVVFVQESIGSGRIIALDWETGDVLFNVATGSRPTSLSYSPLGTYVLYTNPGFDSLRMLDAVDGLRMPYFDEGFGAVSFIQMARSERNIMTYVPSRGEFIYWQVQTANELQTVPTRSRLSHLTLVDIATQRYLAASDGSQLLIVDNLTGEVRASYPVAPVHGITYDAESDRILVLTEQLGVKAALAFTFSSGRLRRDFYRPQSLHAGTAVLAAAGAAEYRGFLAGGADGQIAIYERRNGRRHLLGPAPTDRVSDIAFTPGRLHLSLGDRLLTIESDLFADDLASMGATFLVDRLHEFPELSQMRVTSDGGNLFSWSPSVPGTVWLHHEGHEPVVVYEDEDHVAVISVTSNQTGLLVMHRDGRIIQTDRDSEGVRFTYTALGSQDAVWDPRIGLIVAKGRTTTFDTSIVQVDQRTLETVGAATDAFLTLRLAWDEANSTLYAMGLHGRQTAPTTRLLRLGERGFSVAARIHEVPGEFAPADLIWDDRAQRLLSTVELGRVVRYANGAADPFERTERVHGRIAAGGGFVAAVNTDGTVSLWNRATGAYIADLVVMEGQWIAIAAAGPFVSSTPALERYLTYLPAEGTRLALENFRVTLPFDEELLTTVR